jgi:hypothetical protein
MDVENAPTGINTAQVPELVTGSNMFVVNQYNRRRPVESAGAVDNELPKVVTPIGPVYSMRSAGLSQLSGQNFG